MKKITSIIFYFNMYTDCSIKTTIMTIFYRIFVFGVLEIVYLRRRPMPLQHTKSVRGVVGEKPEY